MTQTIRIEAALPCDAALLPAIEQSAGELFRTAPGLEWVADHDNTPADFYGPLIAAGTVWVAREAAAGPVGFLSAEAMGGGLHLWEMAVRQDRQGRGLGRRLLAEARDLALARGLNGLTLTTFRDVAWNAPFYERQGFRVIQDDALAPWMIDILIGEIDRGLPGERRCAMRLDLGESIANSAHPREGGDERKIYGALR
jgi:GNAT superfamily N-acetyltransferase